jgi:DNA repair photolyase
VRDGGAGKTDGVRLVWFIDHPSARAWSVNPYRGCGIRCVYCIARSQGKAEPWFGADRIVEELRARLEAVPPEVEVGLGSLVDAYPPEEEGLGLTRLVLAELSRQGRPFCVNTKSDLVLRDKDILVRHQGHCDVYLSIATLDEAVASRLEVNAPSVAARLRAVSVLKQAGVDVNIDASPWIPGASDIGALLGAIPEDVRIQVAPLDIECLGPKATIAGRRYKQNEILAAYREHRKRVGEHPGIRWKD